MNWVKKGLIYCPDGKKTWARHYAFPPTPYWIAQDRLRIYVAFCDEKPVGRIGYVDLDPEDPSKVLGVSEKPVLDIGAPGAFDDNGVVPTCLLTVGEKLYLYYVGFQLGTRVTYFLFEGLAVSTDGGETFTRHSTVPILERSRAEQLNRTASFVLEEEGLYKMWYTAGSEWTRVEGKPMPLYNIRYLESKDPARWGPEGRVCFALDGEQEYACGRPWILRENGTYKMFNSIRTRSKNYRLGYAESTDGIHWTRQDQKMGLEVSSTGWDSQMLAYSSLARHKDRTYLFYNGNQCGKTGFGYALLEP